MGLGVFVSLANLVFFCFVTSLLVPGNDLWFFDSYSLFFWWVGGRLACYMERGVAIDID